jgi:hypothetical protein
MRIKRVVPADRRQQLAAAAGLLIITVVAAAGCSGSPSSARQPGFASAAASAPVDQGSEAAAPAAAASSAAGYAGGMSGVPSGSSAGSSGSSAGSSTGSSAGKLVAAGPQLIETAELSVRAASVSAAVSRATALVTAAGGYISGENASAGAGHPDQATATVTFKIPVSAYRATLAALSGTGLGTQLSLSQQAQDVTQQVADTNSRVASDEAAISQLRALLKHAGSVSELLSVQSEINAQESDLEAMLAQQSALDHETSYATVTLTLVGPKAVIKPKPQPAPPGIGGGLVRGWHALAVAVDWLLTALGAAAPFLAVAAVLGALAWWVRRTIRRRQPPAPEPEPGS